MNDQKRLPFKRKLKRAGLFLAFAFLLPIFLTFLPTPGWSDVPDGQKFITITAQEVINDDLYLTADTITIDGIIKGDAVVAASQITLNGTIEGDLIAAGRIITVNGTVNDDVRMAGLVLILSESARVNDDVIAAGYSLENKTGSTIAGNLNYFGGQGLFAGTVQQNIRGAAAGLQLAGQVKGNVNVTVGNHDLSRPSFIPDTPAIPQVPAGLTLTDTAQLDGELTYRSEADAKIAPGATVAGRVVQEDMPSSPEQSTNAAYGVFWQLQRLVALGLVGWLLLRFVPGWMQTLSATVQARPLPSFGWGIVAEVAVVVGAIALCALTVLFLIVSGILLPSLALPILGIGLLAIFSLLIGFSIVASFVPPIVISFLGGKWLVTKLQPDRATSNVTTLVVGLVAFVILTAIPVVGGILNGIVVLLGLGAIWLWWRKSDRGSTELQRPLSAV